jgi:methylmalonyl-CoA mutase cobalamin-binding subunit
MTTIAILHDVLKEDGIHVAQLVIGGAIVEGDEEKDPAKLADVLWDLHARRDRLRVEVAT